MLITEMLITQGVTNMPYKSPHPRHTERNRMMTSWEKEEEVVEEEEAILSQC